MKHLTLDGKDSLRTVYMQCSYSARTVVVRSNSAHRVFVQCSHSVRAVFPECLYSDHRASQGQLMEFTRGT